MNGMRDEDIKKKKLIKYLYNAMKKKTDEEKTLLQFI